MPQINIVVNGHAYTMACDEGQEEHLRKLGEFVDGKVRALIASVGQAGDARLILMAALVVADELTEALARLESRDNEREALNVTADRTAETLENAAARLEAIAARLG